MSGTRAALALSALLAFASPASAQDIGPNQEERVLGLFAPHQLGQEVSHGFALWNVRIERDHIDVALRGPDGRETTLVLSSAERSSEELRCSASFAARPGGADDPDALAARRALLAALRTNDDGHFWAQAGETITFTGPRTGPSTTPRWFSHWGENGWVPIDGMAVILLVYLLALLLAGRLLAREPRWMAGALAGVVVAGVLARLALSPATFLGAWPWSRLYPHVNEVAEGRWLAAVAEVAGHPFFLTDVMMWTNFAYAAAMPLVLFSHATYLLRDARAGLAASFFVAFLPQHIRFSRCEDGFVASLVLTSLAFALLHGFLRDGSRVVRWLLVCALPFVLYPGYLLRPLNLLFVVVYAAAILALHTESAPRGRRAVALGLVLAVGGAAAVQFLRTNAETVQAATSSLGWITNTLEVLVRPTLLVLSDPTRTPPVAILLAIAGGVLAWRAGERRLVLFLGGWLLLFVGLHAFVVQETMQPRYHLHLVVPFLLLAAIGAVRLAPRFGRWSWGIAAVMALSPLIYAPFVRDTGYVENAEYDFVRQARDVVPEGCTVVEYTGSPYEVDELRFSRIGALAGPYREHRFIAVGVFADGRTRPAVPTLDELRRDPPECLYFYEGLACTSHAQGRETYASMCLTLRERLGAEPVLEARARGRFYDSQNAPREPVPRPESVPLRLSRARISSR